MAKIGPSFRAPALKINLPSGDDHRRRRPHPKVEEGDDEDDDDDYHLTFQYLRRPKRFSECQVTFIREGRPKANKWDLFCSRQSYLYFHNVLKLNFGTLSAVYITTKWPPS